MSIIIFGDLFTFPDGSAATNRVHTYAKGFTEHGFNCHVITFFNQINEQFEGNIDGYSYYIPFKQKKRGKYLAQRRFHKFMKYIYTLALIRKLHKKEKVIVINVWTNLLLTHLFAWLLARMCGAKLMVECSEHPLRKFQGSTINRIQGEIKFFLESRLSDGVFCISRYLVDFYLEHGVPIHKLLLVPSTVDPSRFEGHGKSPLAFRYIGYFGSLSFTRDNIDVLIKGFAQVKHSFPDIHLVLGGFCTQQEKVQLMDLISELNLDNDVHVLGYLTRSEILRYICNSEILVMVRSNDLQSKASYPSKLTEFLSTGKPVITSNVGEISNYLNDREHVYFVEAGDVDGMAATINELLTDYAKAEQTGKNGKSLTDSVFNYHFQSGRIIKYIGNNNHREL
jgi:glycosyltransferase involved in cell wall biosynthesis